MDGGNGVRLIPRPGVSVWQIFGNLDLTDQLARTDGASVTIEQEITMRFCVNQLNQLNELRPQD